VLFCGRDAQKTKKALESKNLTSSKSRKYHLLHDRT
jgi:hypothetical protein